MKPSFFLHSHLQCNEATTSLMAFDSFFKSFSRPVGFSFCISVHDMKIPELYMALQIFSSTDSNWIQSYHPIYMFHPVLLSEMDSSLTGLP